MKVTLYSTGCLNCNMLSQKLNEKNIKYEVCGDINVMTEKGMMSAPCLEVDGEIFTYRKALEWLNNQGV